MSHKSHSYYSVSSSRAPIRNTADYSPFGIQLDGRTLSYVPPAPAPPSVTVVYQHKFDDNPSTHPYTTAPNQLNTKLTNVSWTNSQSSWTNFAGFTGKAIATNSATPDTTRLYLNLTVNSGFMLDVKSYSFYHRSSTTGYTNYQLLVNGVLVGSGSIFVSSGSTLQSTGTINVANAIAGLTGSVTVTLKLFGGSNGNNATFRLDDFTLNGYTQEVQVYAESYRYGFQNQEKDDEIKGAGNSVNFEYRMHDPRVGRFFAVDPLTKSYPYLTPYQFSSNSPISLIELEGLEGVTYLEKFTNSKGETVIRRIVEVDIHVGISQKKDSNQGFYVKNDKKFTKKSNKLLTGIKSDLEKDYNQGFKDSEEHEVVFKFNVFDYNADQYTPEQYREVLKAQNKLTVQSINDETVIKGVTLTKENLGDLTSENKESNLGYYLGCTIRVNNQMDELGIDNSHTISHEVGHFMLFAHPDKNYSQMTEKFHSDAGGIFKYGNMILQKLSPDSNNFSGKIEDRENVNQNNVNEILKSVKEIKK